MDLHFDNLMDEIMKSPKDSKPYLKMGQHLLFEGCFSESLGFLKKAKKMGDESFELNFLLGKAYLFLSCSEKSLNHFKKALYQRPNHRETQYIIDTLVEERHFTVQSLSPSVVKEIFDGYAAQFESHLLKKLNYETPKKLVKYLLGQIELDEIPLSILDLGCGTGLFAQELKQRLTNSQMVGVDFSSKMLKEAAKKDLYQKLCEEDLFSYLDREKEKNTTYDLVAACDTVPYFGDLEKFFEKCSQVVRTRGTFLFSFEAIEDPKRDWRFSSNGRFKHSLEYVMSLAKKNDFRGEVKLETLREEKGERVQGFFFWGRSIKIEKTDKSF